MVIGTYLPTYARWQRSRSRGDRYLDIYMCMEIRYRRKKLEMGDSGIHLEMEMLNEWSLEEIDHDD